MNDSKANEAAAEPPLDCHVGRNRPADEPGGCECIDCGCIFIGAEWHVHCAVCFAAHDVPNK